MVKPTNSHQNPTQHIPVTCSQLGGIAVFVARLYANSGRYVAEIRKSKCTSVITSDLSNNIPALD